MTNNQEDPYIQRFINAHPDWRDARSIAEYQVYVNELSKRLPGSYDRLKRFLGRGNCTCCNEKRGNCESACNCADKGGNCACAGKYNTGHKCERCETGSLDCSTCQVDDAVRIYEIYPKDKGKEWEKFLRVSTFRVSQNDQFIKLQNKLVNPDFPPEEGKTKHNAEEDPNHPCRIITVSHLSPNVAKLLGKKFNISADFFNRHLPGTDAISKRLISRLPSAVQIDLDKLYKSYEAFD